MHCFQPAPRLIRSLRATRDETEREGERELRRPTEEVRELESSLVWRPRLSLTARHAGSRGATAAADCGPAKVTVASVVIGLDGV